MTKKTNPLGKRPWLKEDVRDLKRYSKGEDAGRADIKGDEWSVGCGRKS